MQNPMYISINGQKQGLIISTVFTQELISNSWQEGYENVDYNLHLRKKLLQL